MLMPTASTLAGAGPVGVLVAVEVRADAGVAGTTLSVFAPEAIRRLRVDKSCGVDVRGRYHGSGGDGGLPSGLTMGRM